MQLISWLIAVYAVICVAVYFGNRRLMYFPDPTRVAPARGEVAPMPGGHGEVRLANGAHLEVSRRRFKSLMDRLARL